VTYTPEGAMTTPKDRRPRLLMRRWCVCVVAVLAVMAAGPAFGEDKNGPAERPDEVVVIEARQEAPRSYKAYCADRTHFFVMLAPMRAEEEAAQLEGAHREDLLALRRAYPRSGMYRWRNDGSPELLWAVGWYSGRVLVANDGAHVVELGSGRAASLDDEHVRLHARGRLVATRSARSMVDEDWMLSKDGGGAAQWLDTADLDDLAMTYSLRTKDANRFVFDLRTGEVVSEHRPIRSLRGKDTKPRPWLLGGCLAALALGALLFGLWLYRRQKALGEGVRAPAGAPATSPARRTR
jgi:hypothetical protein